MLLFGLLFKIWQNTGFNHDFLGFDVYIFDFSQAFNVGLLRFQSCFDVDLLGFQKFGYFYLKPGYFCSKLSGSTAEDQKT